ncbi:MAG: PD40 domain-containing protein [Candidatus Delongbacteria bacterium]|nr:PD40 domain-containing protein [Candidatus Delongbacteria bacterium]
MIRMYGAVVMVAMLGMFCSSNQQEPKDVSSHKIMFTSTLGGSKYPQVFSINDDGTDTVRITNGKGHYGAARWSWDQLWIAAYSAGGASDLIAMDHDVIYLMNRRGDLVDSLLGCGYSGGGGFAWMGQSLKLCYPHTSFGTVSGYYFTSCEDRHCDREHESLIEVKDDSASGKPIVLDGHPTDENRLLAKYQRKERKVVEGRTIVNYYWCLGEISVQGEALLQIDRDQELNIRKARYSPDGKRIAYANGRTITIIPLSNPKMPIDIHFCDDYDPTAFEWSPNSTDLAISLNQGTRSGIYLYHIQDQSVKPIITSDTDQIFLCDYR